MFRGPTKIDRDPASFEELQPPWSRDKAGIYFNDNRIPEADLASFRAISVGNAEDRNYSYGSGGRAFCKIDAEAPGSYPACRGR